MGQVLSAIKSLLRVLFKSSSNHDDLSTEEGQARRDFVEGDMSIPQIENIALVSNDLSTEGGLERRAFVGGDTPDLRKRETFALVIGINKYQWVPNEYLQGAVRDAENFKSYLLEYRRVPAANVFNLRDEQATRSAIIQKFRDLERNPRIIPGEAAIIIYFAGHGAVARKPTTWTNWETPSGNVEMLCPADINAPDANGKVIEGIPDRTISRLLLDLSKAKGNNITLILDCCHAAGMNRGYGNSESRSRNFQGIQNLSPTCDEHIYSHTTSSQDNGVSGFSNSFFRSHVLLAACKHGQTAREQNREGVFTKALLRALKELSPGDPPPTYLSLIKHLTDMPHDQTPQLDGKYVRRRLFDCWQEPASNSMIPCHKGNRKRWPSSLILHAGLLHGIEKDSTFEIFESEAPPKMKAPVATLKVTEVENAISRLMLTSPDSDIFTVNTRQPLWYARLRNTSGRLKIYCDDRGVLAWIPTDSDESRLTVPVISVSTPEEADLCLTVKDNTVFFHRGKRISEFSSCFPCYPSCPVHARADTRDFINHYAHFTSHLAAKSPVPITDFVAIKMIKLDDTGESDSEVVLTPAKNGAHTEVVVDTSIPFPDRDHYGFTIYNRCGVELYIYLLYLDATKSEIDAWYSSRKGQNEGSVDSCLGKELNSKLTLGHGSSAMQPLTFDVPDGQDEDVCFIKIFVTTKAVDIGPIEQPESPRADGKLRSAMLVPKKIATPSGLKWASKTITIVSKRNKNVISKAKSKPPMP
ncbi:caspase domain-containing protein [Armillaria borealis]|uniref:Caspase domain-containing protein n=1 Tax=Armillaria borealis TaxID=47425 RepID=A0AA39JSM1_9AGAR|nr:caspase domain-containing protein [Armillaria borealis]